MELPAEIHLPAGLGGLCLNALAVMAAIAWPRRGAGAADEDRELLERLRAGDEEAFIALVTRHNPMLLRLARSLVPSAAVAEEVVQDTWLGALRGLDRFAGRSSLKTWLLRILVNRARSTGALEHRTVAVGDAEPAVERSRFDAAGMWASPPHHWVEDSDERLLAESLAAPLHAALGELPERQREVVMLRDVDGLSSREVCEVLEISEGNQRVLLHRGRSRLRRALEAAMGGEPR